MPASNMARARRSSRDLERMAQTDAQAAGILPIAHATLEVIAIGHAGSVVDARVGRVELGAFAQVVVVAENPLACAAAAHMAPAVGAAVAVARGDFRSAGPVDRSHACRIGAAAVGTAMAAQRARTVVRALVVGTDLQRVPDAVAAQGELPVVTQLGKACAQGQRAAFPVGIEVMAVLLAARCQPSFGAAMPGLPPSVRPRRSLPRQPEGVTSLWR